MKRGLLLLIVCVTGIVSFAQSIEDGKKFLYYERNKSALQVFKKLYSDKPSDPTTIYWLGQAYIANDDIASAKTLYAQAKADEPLVLIGAGHIDVLEKNGTAAKEKFDKALETGKSKKGVYNTEQLIAVGRANADGNNKIGDAPYAVEKLKLAAEQDKKNAEADLLLGICYLKMGREYGGDAVLAFREAVNRNPSYAKANYRMGRIYQVQKSYELMDEEFQKAIKADAAFPLTYLAYFLHYQYRDVALAKENLDKYVAASDKDCNSDYYLADYLYRAGKYTESLDKAKAMEEGECKDFARVSYLYALNYDKLNNAEKAKTYLDKYFAVAQADKILPADYEFAAKFYSKLPGSEAAAINYYLQAADLSTVKNEKIEFINAAIKVAADAKLLNEQLSLVSKAAALKGGYQENDYFNLTKAATEAKSFLLADSLSKAYIAAFPDKPQGYAFNVSVAKALDADTSKGMAVEPLNRYNEFLLKDTAKNKKAIYSNYYYLLIYYAQKAGDVKNAIDITGKMMELYKEGEEYSFAKNIYDQLVKKQGKGQK